MTDEPTTATRPGVGAGAREEILAAAAEVFHALGYAAATIDDVADRLGATKGRIYHYYRSKADLYFDLQIATMNRLTSAIEAIARGPGDVEERLYAMAHRHAEILMTDSASQKVAVRGIERRLRDVGSPRHHKTVRHIIKLRDDYEQLFAELIDEGIRKGVFVDLPPRLATKPFLGVINWLTVWFTPRRLGNSEDVQELARIHAEFALRGLRREADR